MLSGQNIAFIGFMGVGKTTVGYRLANSLNYNFIDTDKEVEKHLNMQVSDVFLKYGEKYFRDTEEKVITNLFDEKINNTIFSLGGGSFLNEKVYNVIKKNSISVWLDAKIDIIYERIKLSKNIRPLLKEINDINELEKLLIRRKSFYKKADIRVNVLKVEKKIILNIVKKELETYLNEKKLSNS